MTLYGLSLAVAATTIALSGGVGALAWRRRPEPGATWLAVAMFATCWWVAALAIGMGTDTLAGKLFWVRLEWIGVVVLPVAWFLFALEYTGRTDGLSRPAIGAVVAAVAAVVALIWANPRGAVRSDLALEVGGGVAMLDQTYGPLFWLLVGAMLTLASIGTGMMLTLAFRSRSLYRGQAAALSASALLPLVGVGAFLADVVPWPALHAIPIAFTLSGVLNVWSVSRYRLLERLPVPRRVARDIVVEQMDDGVVVIDGCGEIVDVNDRAATLLGEPEALVGAPAERHVPEYGVAFDEGETIAVASRGRWLKVRVTPIRNGCDRITGRVAVLRDVTDRRHRQQRLDVLNRVLRHNLRNEINVVYGFADRLDDASDDDVAGMIKETASGIVELADKAREVERILDEANADGEPIDLLAALDCALGEIEANVDGATIELERPGRSGVYAHRIVEPIVANLVENVLRNAETDDPSVGVRVAAVGDDVRIDVAAEGADVQPAELSAVRDGSETQLDHANGLRLWLVVWGTRRIGGSVTFHTEDDDAVVTFRFDRCDPHDRSATTDGVGRRSAEN